MEQRRFDAVLAVLNGTIEDAADLNYQMRGWNLGLVAWGANPEAAVVAIGRALERPALCVKVGGDTAWGWLGGRAKFGPESQQRLLCTRIPDGTSIAIGEGGTGVEGFRRTHRQARDAQRIGMALGHRLTRYSDVAVEALALRDPDGARQFVDQVLSPLKHARNANNLRQTLTAYLRCGFNASATASSIGVNDRTVAYRLKTIEKLIAQPLTSAWFELEAALRLERVLAGGNVGSLGGHVDVRLGYDPAGTGDPGSAVSHQPPARLACHLSGVTSAKGEVAAREASLGMLANLPLRGKWQCRHHSGGHNREGTCWF
jgi:PucR C-terminal helix-turn-helix domain/GGDEF-like domain